MSPLGLSRAQHTEFAGTMETDAFAGPYGQFGFVFPAPFLYSVFFFLGWGGPQDRQTYTPE